MRLYMKLVVTQLKSQLQDRMSFLFLCASQALMSLTGVIALLILVNEHTSVGGYSRNELLFLYSIVLMSYAIAECFFRGFDQFPKLLANGGFDRILVRPINVIIQILGSTIEFSRFGRLIVGCFTMFYCARGLAQVNILLLILMIMSGVFLFSCLYVIQGSICFYTIDSIELMNVFTDGSKEFGKLPFGLYGKQVLFILTWIVPLALFQYYPGLVLLGKSTDVLYALCPILSLLFIIPTLLLWRTGRRHYQSTGS